MAVPRLTADAIQTALYKAYLPQKQAMVKYGIQFDKLDGMSIEPVKPSDYQRVLDFLREHYYKEEPLTIGSQPLYPDTADEEFNMSNIKYGTCLMALQKTMSSGAIDENDNLVVTRTNGIRSSVIGVVLSGTKSANESQHLFDEAEREGDTKWGKILKFLAHVERDANCCGKFGVNRVMHAHVLAVSRHFRGHSIGASLMKRLFKVGNELNYPLLTVDCTSMYSAKLCERLGMECINCVYYKDYLDENGDQVFKPPPPHDCVKTYAMPL